MHSVVGSSAQGTSRLHGHVYGTEHDAEVLRRMIGHVLAIDERRLRANLPQRSQCAAALPQK